MTIGLILLTVTGLLILFGALQRVLDRLRLTDTQAIVFVVLIIAGGFVPDIPVTDRFLLQHRRRADPAGAVRLAVGQGGQRL